MQLGDIFRVVTHRIANKVEPRARALRPVLINAAIIGEYDKAMIAILDGLFLLCYCQVERGSGDKKLEGKLEKGLLIGLLIDHIPDLLMKLTLGDLLLG